MSSLLDQRNILANVKAPQSLSTIGKSYDVAVARSTSKNPNTVSTIALLQNKQPANSSNADRWDSAELVETVIHEAEAARRQRQLEKAIRTKNRTTLVDREKQRNKERADARLGGGGVTPTAEGGAATDSPTNTSAINNVSSAGGAGGAATNNTSLQQPLNTSTIPQPIGTQDPNRSANSFAQVQGNPMKKLLQLNMNGLPEAGSNGSNTEIGGGGGGARRGVAVLSSPRQNPMLAEKLNADMTSVKLDQFLQTAAKAMPHLDDLVSRNLSVATTRKLRREAILARQQRRLMKGRGDGTGSDAGDVEDTDDEAETQKHLANGVGTVGIRGAINRQREHVATMGAIANETPTAVATTNNTTGRINNAPAGGAVDQSNGNHNSSSFYDPITGRVNSPMRAHSPNVTSTLKLPDGLKANVSFEQDRQRIAHHTQQRRPGSPAGGGNNGNSPSRNGNNTTTNATNNNTTTNNNNANASSSVANAAVTSSNAVVLPPNATFLQVAAKASIADAINAAEALDKKLGTATTIKTSTDKHGNIVKLDGVMLLDEHTTTVTAQGVAIAAKMAKVGAADTKAAAGNKGFFGRSASPLQLLQIPDGAPIESTTTYKPGAALATLVDNKSKLSRTTFIEARRETSSFNAPPRPALLMPTCAPLNASYHIRYGAVERHPPSSSFANQPHHKFNQLEKNKELSRKLAKEAEDASYALTHPSNASGVVNNLSAISRQHRAEGGDANGSSRSPLRSGSPTNNDPNSTFFNLTQAKLGDSSPNNNNRSRGGGNGSEYESNSSGGTDADRSRTDGGDKHYRRRAKRNHELIPTANRPEVREEAIFRMNNTTAPDPSILAGPTDTKDYRQHDVRDTSSAFKAAPREFTTANLQDLFYYPLPEPGLANYTGGKIVGNARKRAWTPFGKPCGAPTSYNLDLIDERHRQIQRERKTPAFEKVVGRDDQKHPFVDGSKPNVDTSQFSYKEQKATAVDKRTSCYVTMHKQVARPQPKLASKTEAPHMNLNSIVSVPKKGFVDIGRMTNYDTRDPDFFATRRANDTTTPLFINNDSVLYTAPAFSFKKGPLRFAEKDKYPPRAQSSMAVLGGGDGGGNKSTMMSNASTLSALRRPKSTEPTDYGYSDDSPVRRRAPAAAFPITDRETRPILRVPAPGDYAKGVQAQVFAAKDQSYDLDKFEAHHKPSANFTTVVSRDSREKVLKQRFASTDAVYDVSSSAKAKMVLPFDKTTGRN